MKAVTAVHTVMQTAASNCMPSNLKPFSPPAIKPAEDKQKEMQCFRTGRHSVVISCSSLRFQILIKISWIKHFPFNRCNVHYRINHPHTQF